MEPQALAFISMEPQAFARPTVRWPHYDDDLQVMQPVPSGIERLPLEHSHNEQLPQFAPGREGLEVAYAEVASTPRQQAVVHTVQGAKNVKAALLKRVQIYVCAGFSILAVTIIIVAVVVTLKTKSHAQSMSGSHQEVTTNTISSLTLNTPGPTSSPTLRASSGSVTNEVDIPRPTSGAYNGTGMTALTPPGSPNSYQVVLYYQHCTGAIRTARLPFEGPWQPYDFTQDLLVPSGARNGTPLANSAYGEDGNTVTLVTSNLMLTHTDYCQQLQLFYVDLSNNLRDILRPGAGAAWGPGLLSKANIRVSNAASTGLAANTNPWYSDQQKNFGIVVFYGGTDGLVHELTWHESNSSWTDGFIFPGTNGNAGFDTQRFGSTLSVILVNAIGCLEVWWRDFNLTDNSNYTWTKGSTSSEPMQPNTSVANDWGGQVYAQYANNSFVTCVLGVENSAATLANFTLIEGIDGIPESRITELTVMLDYGRTIRTIFVQVNGSGITQVQQLTPSGPWNQAAIPVD